MRMPIFLIAVFLASSALAQDRTTYFLTGNQLHEICSKARAQAQAYLMGFNDGVALRDEVNKQGSFCPPSTVKSGQFVDLVCQELERQPGNRHWPASYIVHDALSRTWPCAQ